MKTSDAVTHREFESHTLRQKRNPPQRGGFSFLLELGIRKSNPSCRGQLGRRRLDGGETIIFCVAENANESLTLRAAHRAASRLQNRKEISKVYINNKKEIHPKGVDFCV